MIRFKGDVYIAPEQIISIEPGDNGYSQINTVSGVCFVSESPQEVARKVLEWRLAMEDYRIFIQGATVDGDYNLTDRLFELAGLEE